MTFIAFPPVLGSLWTLAPAAAMTLLLVARTVLEERLRRRVLPGYEEYMSQTRWRVVPGIWKPLLKRHSNALTSMSLKRMSNCLPG